jgi:hypothetical protein
MRVLRRGDTREISIQEVKQPSRSFRPLLDFTRLHGARSICASLMEPLRVRLALTPGLLEAIGARVRHYTFRVADNYHAM